MNAEREIFEKELRREFEERRIKAERDLERNSSVISMFLIFWWFSIFSMIGVPVITLHLTDHLNIVPYAFWLITTLFSIVVSLVLFKWLRGRENAADRFNNWCAEKRIGLVMDHNNALYEFFYAYAMTPTETRKISELLFEAEKKGDLANAFHAMCAELRQKQENSG